MNADYVDRSLVRSDVACAQCAGNQEEVRQVAARTGSCTIGQLSSCIHEVGMKRIRCIPASRCASLARLLTAVVVKAMEVNETDTWIRMAHLELLPMEARAREDGR